MMNLVFSIFSSSSSSKEEDTDYSKVLVYDCWNNWSVPKISNRVIVEKTVSISNCHEVISMIIQDIIKLHKQKYEFIHIRMMQVAIKPLVRRGLNTTILLCLRDGCFTNSQDSLLV